MTLIEKLGIAVEFWVMSEGLVSLSIGVISVYQW